MKMTPRKFVKYTSLCSSKHTDFLKRTGMEKEDHERMNSTVSDDGDIITVNFLKFCRKCAHERLPGETDWPSSRWASQVVLGWLIYHGPKHASQPSRPINLTEPVYSRSHTNQDSWWKQSTNLAIKILNYDYYYQPLENWQNWFVFFP